MDELNSLSTPIDVETEEETATQEGAGRMGGMTQGDVTLQGVTFTDSYTDFMDSTAEIVEGEHLTRKKHYCGNTNIAQQSDLLLNFQKEALLSQQKKKLFTSKLITYEKSTS